METNGLSVKVVKALNKIQEVMKYAVFVPEKYRYFISKRR
jgi:hypothetical protein